MVWISALVSVDYPPLDRLLPTMLRLLATDVRLLPTGTRLLPTDENDKLLISKTIPPFFWPKSSKT